MIDPPINLPDRLTIEPDRVIMRGDLATAALFDVAYDGTPGVEAFRDQFEHVDGPGGLWLAREDYYQGVTVTAVIRRLSDGRLFGYPYWQSLSPDDSAADYEANGDKHGFDDYRDEWCLKRDGYEDDDLNEVYVWLPVEAFTITGYRVIGGGDK